MCTDAGVRGIYSKQQHSRRLPLLPQHSQRSDPPLEVQRRRKMADRAALQRAAYSWHKRRGDHLRGTRCPWCLEPIDRESSWDLHEALVNRGAVPKDKQDLIMVRFNVVPVHHECHMAHGSTRTMLHRCLRNLCYNLEVAQIGRWYVDLWDEKGLSVRKGILLPKKLVKAAVVLAEYIPAGEKLSGWVLPKLSDDEWLISPGTQHARDYRALATMRWHGKSIKKINRPPPQHRNVRLDRLLTLIDAGYYFYYLCGVFGADPRETMEWDKSPRA